MNSDSPVIIEPVAQPKKSFSLYSIISVVTGALSYLLIFLHSVIDMSLVLAAILAPISALAAIITGTRSKREIRHAEGAMSGRKVANTGLILGYLYFIIGIFIVVIAVLLFGGLISGLTHLLGSLGIK